MLYLCSEMEEIWKDIAGYEGLYQVSNFGVVRSYDRMTNTKGNGKQLRKGRVLKQENNRGYKCISLYKDEKRRKHFKIHRLVAESFIPNPNNLPEVNHIDENKSNNRVDNLEWVSHRYNMNYGTARERQKVKTSKPVLQYTKSGEFISEYQSIIDAGRHTCIHNGNISLCCIGKIKSAGGYVWKYKDI